MHAVCTKEGIQKALEVAVRISARNHALPILQSVRLGVKNGVLEVRATNLELGFVAKLTVEEKTAGTVAVSAQTLLQTVALITSPTCTLHTSGDVLVVESSHGRSELKTLPHDDFPTISILESNGFTVEGGLVASGIKNVVFAASQSSIKPELGAVYVYQKKQQTLTFVATDSFRLAEQTIPLTTPSFPHPILIPQRNAVEIARTIDVLNESPTVFITTNQIALSFPSGVYLVSRLIEGNFPDYEQIIPKEYQTYTTALVKDLEHALRSVNIFANKFMQVGLVVSPEHNTITCKSENGEYGRAEEVVRVDGHGAELTLSFNQQYLMESLGRFASDSIELAFAGIGRPLVIKSKDSDTFRYLVMPMNK
jgi:DNA polymerase-3 subunit beta